MSQSLNELVYLVLSLKNQLDVANDRITSLTAELAQLNSGTSVADAADALVASKVQLLTNALRARDATPAPSEQLVGE